MPWVTGFLCNILITYLEKYHPAQEKKIDYGRIAALAGPPWSRRGDAKSLIRDANRWMPQTILRELIRVGEKAAGDKELTYRATIDYFARQPRPFPSVFEVIAEMIDDMETTLALAGYWAGGFANYLRLQACVPVTSQGREALVLCRFEESVRPALANLQFVRGHLEGFARLYPFVHWCRCEEEISQFRLEDLVRDFEGYEAEVTDRTLIIRSRESGLPAVEAEAVVLQEEPCLTPRLEEMGALPAPIVSPVGTRLKVLRASDPVFAGRLSRKRNAGRRAFRIIQGACLEGGGMSLCLEKGRVFNAPYSRFRLTWAEKSGVGVRESQPPSPLRRAGQLLEHLKAMKESQVRLLDSTAENRGLENENLRLRETVDRSRGFDRLIGESPAMRNLLVLLRSLSELDTTILIQGETGTGKDLVARAIHENGHRKERRFLAINCGALSETLLDSELFGYERGAFTGAVSRHEGKFEQADGGTLFLDEIGEISPAMQVKLLRVLENGEIQRIGGREDVKVDVRVLADTHHDLKSLVERGTFRMDLYYRLNVVEVRPPPLRERREDIPLLAAHFIDSLSGRLKKSVRGLSPEAMTCLVRYHWPGNVRELAHVIERSIILAPRDAWIEPDQLPAVIHEASPPGPLPADRGLLEWMDRADWGIYRHSLERAGSLSGLIRAIEARIVHKAVRGHQGNKTRAARALRRSYRWLRKVEKQIGPDLPA